VFASIFDSNGNEVITAEAKLRQGQIASGNQYVGAASQETYAVFNETEGNSPAFVRDTSPSIVPDPLPNTKVKPVQGILPEGTNLSFLQRPGQTGTIQSSN